MALTASRITAGFEPVRHLKNQPMVPHDYELTPGVAFNKGDLVVLTAGKVAKAAAGATNVLGAMATACTAAENPADKTTFGRVYDDPDIVFRCTFADHRDGTATGGTATTLVDATLAGADDDWNGALLYVYEGTNAGQVRTVTDYVAATGTLTFAEPMPSACDATSKYILLGAGGAGGVINVGTIGVNIKDARTIDANASVAAEAGPLKVEKIYPADLMMDVTIRKHI